MKSIQCGLFLLAGIVIGASGLLWAQSSPLVQTQLIHFDALSRVQTATVPLEGATYSTDRVLTVSYRSDVLHCNGMELQP